MRFGRALATVINQNHRPRQYPSAAARLENFSTLPIAQMDWGNIALKLVYGVRTIEYTCARVRQ